VANVAGCPVGPVYETTLSKSGRAGHRVIEGRSGQILYGVAELVSTQFFIR
jgi:hypothetical protein